MAYTWEVLKGKTFGPGDSYEGTLVVPTSVYVNLTGTVLWLKNNTGKKCKWVPLKASSNSWWSRYTDGGGLTQIRFS